MRVQTPAIAFFPDRRGVPHALPLGPEPQQSWGLSAQARVSAVTLTVAPLAFLLVIATADASVLAVVVGSGIGRTCLLVGLLLDALGWWWMRHLVKEVSR